jgi:hypothetical protein
MRKLLAVLAVMLATGARAFDATPLLSFFQPSTAPSFAPPSGCILWLEADYGATPTEGTVTNWADRSGMANDATNTQGTGCWSVPNVLNGNPVMRFGGTNSWLSTKANPSTNAHTIIYIAIIRGWVNFSEHYQAPIGYGRTIAIDRGFPHGLYGTESPYYPCSYPIYNVGGSYDYTGDNNKRYYTNDVPYMIALPLAVGSWTLWRNGVSEGSGTATGYPGDLTGMMLGRASVGGTGSRWWCGDFAAVLVFSRQLSNAEVNTVQAYLATKYGLSVSQLP